MDLLTGEPPGAAVPALVWDAPGFQVIEMPDGRCALAPRVLAIPPKA